MSLFSHLRRCCDVAVWRNPSPPGQKQSAINRWTGVGNFGIQKTHPCQTVHDEEMMLCYIIVVLGPDRVGNWWCAYTWATNRNTLVFKLTGRMGDFTFLMIEAETSCATHSKSTSQDFYLAHIVVHSQHLFRKDEPIIWQEICQGRWVSKICWDRVAMTKLQYLFVPWTLQHSSSHDPILTNLYHGFCRLAPFPNQTHLPILALELLRGHFGSSSIILAYVENPAKLLWLMGDLKGNYYWRHTHFSLGCFQK